MKKRLIAFGLAVALLVTAAAPAFAEETPAPAQAALETSTPETAATPAPELPAATPAPELPAETPQPTVQPSPKASTAPLPTKTPAATDAPQPTQAPEAVPEEAPKLPQTPETAAEAVAAAATTLQGPTARTREEVIAAWQGFTVDVTAQTNLAQTPDSANYTTAGQVAGADLKNALDTVNLIRYVAGLDTVTLSEEYNSLAQHASTLMAGLGGISHYPPKPDNCPQEFYEKAYQGAGRSNLSWGYDSLPWSIIDGYMYDGDASNVALVGHRRWILNPAMGETGFGFAWGNGAPYSALYAFDTSNTNTGDVEYVTWPAAYTPYQLWVGEDGLAGPLSFQFRCSYGATITDAKAVVTSKLENKTYTFTENGGDGTLYTNCDGYSSLYGCIIFGKGSDCSGSFAKNDELTITVSYKVDGVAYATTYTSTLLDMDALPTVCTVTFDANGGTLNGADTAQVTTGSAYGTLPTVTRSGYQFQGWYTAKTEGSRVYASTVVTATTAHTLYARWKPRIYTVSFDACGGSASAVSKTVNYDAAYGTLPTAQRENYRFLGWYTAASGGTRVTAGTKYTKVGNQKLYAQWKGVSCTVTFDPNGGSCTATTRSYIYGANYASLPTPKRVGYEFAGWYTQKSDGACVTTSTEVTTAAAHTLYAHWTACTYVVTFDPGTGTVSPATGTVRYAGPYGTLPKAVGTEGLAFRGWYTKAEGGTLVDGATTVTATADHTLYAHWGDQNPTVYFIANGGRVGTSQKTVSSGAQYGRLPNAARTGYTFLGWYTAPSGGKRYTDTTTVTTTMDINLYARWRANTYTLSFNANGGRVGTTAKTVRYGSKVGALPKAARTGYTFLGWYTARSGGVKYTITTVMKRAANTTLYARWSANTYKITFNANGGRVGTGSKSVRYASKVGALPKPTCTGRTFLGWYTAKSGGKKYTSTTVMTNAGNLTLYARWK